MLTKTLICYPDSVLITLLIAALGIPLLYAVFRADGYIESAEHHVGWIAQSADYARHIKAFVVL